VAKDMSDIQCEDLLEDHFERDNMLREAEETFRNFYKMVEDILALKEEEKRHVRLRNDSQVKNVKSGVRCLAQ